MGGDEGRGASGVDGESGPCEVKVVRDAAGEGGGGGAGYVVPSLVLIPILTYRWCCEAWGCERRQVVAHTHEHANRLRSLRREDVTGPFKSFVDDFEHEIVCWVEGAGFPGGYAKEGGVEGGN